MDHKLTKAILRIAQTNPQIRKELIHALQKTSMTSQGLSSDRVLTLRIMADKQGSLALAHACGVWLGEERPITTEEQWEERYGDWWDATDQREVMAIRNKRDAANVIQRALSSMH